MTISWPAKDPKACVTRVSIYASPMPRVCLLPLGLERKALLFLSSTVGSVTDQIILLSLQTLLETQRVSHRIAFKAVKSQRILHSFSAREGRVQAWLFCSTRPNQLRSNQDCFRNRSEGGAEWKGKTAVPLRILFASADSISDTSVWPSCVAGRATIPFDFWLSLTWGLAL